MIISKKKRSKDQSFKRKNLKESDGVFIWELCNVKDIAQYGGVQIIALSAQNNYKLSYQFFQSPAIYIKDVASYAFCSKEDLFIKDLYEGQRVNYGNGDTYALIEILDKIKK